MSIEAILMPMFAQVALTFVLLFWMGFLRTQALRTGAVTPEQIALREPNWPLRVTQIGNAYHNQLELPVLFYVVTLLALITETLDVVIYVLSWMFVLSRMVHAYVHVTSNRLDRRGGVFGIGAIALLLMWVIVVARIFLFNEV
ncbi:MAG TPA: MAPEG family protein [Methyloceanibacter sp.]|nr:MAPEG family protein [Methyloceanibacter sp.]